MINTHLHTDHVGWNTRFVDGSWVPTFPNARYLMPELDYRHFSPGGARGTNERDRIVFADSVLPVEPQIALYSGDHQLSESLWLRPAAGHTPGSSVVWLDAGAPAVFVGDVTHCPIQLPRPDDACAFDEDPLAAAVTRKRVLPRHPGGAPRSSPRTTQAPVARLWWPAATRYGRRLARNKRLVDFLDLFQKRDKTSNVPTAEDFQQMLKGAALRVTRPRVAVLTAVHAHPHADTDSLMRAARANFPTSPVRPCTTRSTPHGGLAWFERSSRRARWSAMMRSATTTTTTVCRSCGSSPTSTARSARHPACQAPTTPLSAGFDR